MKPDYKNLPESYWREKLTPQQYSILREKGTEPRFSGELNNVNSPGMYKCAACGQELFSSDSKSHIGDAWPSFDAAISSDRVTLKDDNSYGMQRIEVTCSQCGSHLGHVFPDYGNETGDYFCINSASLEFQPNQA